MGGLGNQMFQYALGRSLAEINGVNFKIDTLEFDVNTPNKAHTYQLNKLNIQENFPSKEELINYRVPVLKYNKLINTLRSLINLPLKKIDNPLIYYEIDDLYFKPEVLKLSDAYIKGYFISYKYFENIKEILKKEFTLKEPLSAYNQEYFKEIKSSNSISIHFRRGDVVEDSVYKGWIDGICTDKYYQNCVNYIAERVADPHFFIFSNDMDWVIENFKLPYKTTYITGNSPEVGYEDLFLMKHCKHNILAGGSTFSWWGAYLNENKAKIVLRPNKMWNIKKYNHPDDYFLPEWINISS